MIDKKDIKHIEHIKKAWTKPKLFSGKGIGFLGLGHVQYSTGPGYTGS